MLKFLGSFLEIHIKQLLVKKEFGVLSFDIHFDKYRYFLGTTDIYIGLN